MQRPSQASSNKQRLRYSDKTSPKTNLESKLPETTRANIKRNIKHSNYSSSADLDSSSNNIVDSKSNTEETQTNKSNTKLQDRVYNLPSQQISMVMESYYNFNVLHRQSKAIGDSSDDDQPDQNSSHQYNSEDELSDDCQQIKKTNKGEGPSKKSSQQIVTKKHHALQKVISNIFQEYDQREQSKTKSNKKISGRKNKQKSKNTSRHKTDNVSRSRTHKDGKKKETQHKKTTQNTKKQMEKSDKILHLLEKEKKKQAPKNQFVDTLEKNTAKQKKYEKVKRKTRVNSKINQVSYVPSEKRILNYQKQIEDEIISKQKNRSRKKSNTNNSMSMNSRKSVKKGKNSQKSKYSQNYIQSRNTSREEIKNRTTQNSIIKNKQTKLHRQMPQKNKSNLNNYQVVKSMQDSFCESPKKTASSQNKFITPIKKNMASSVSDKATRLHLKVFYSDFLSRICSELLLNREIFHLAQYYFIKNLNNLAMPQQRNNPLTNTSSYDILSGSNVYNSSVLPILLLASLILAIKFDDSALAKPFFRELVSYRNHHDNNLNHYSYYQSLSASTVRSRNQTDNQQVSLSLEQSKNSIQIKTLNNSQLFGQEDNTGENLHKLSIHSLVPSNPSISKTEDIFMKKEELLKKIPMIFKKRTPHRSLPYLKKLKQIIGQVLKLSPSASTNMFNRQDLVRMERQICFNLQFKLFVRTISYYIDYLTLIWDNFIEMLLDGMGCGKNEGKYQSSINCLKKMKNKEQALLFRKMQEKTKFQYLVELTNYYKFYEQTAQNQEYNDILFIYSIMYILLRINITIFQEKHERQDQHSQSEFKKLLSHLKNQLNQSTSVIYVDDTGINILFTQFLDLDTADCKIKMEHIVNHCQKITKYLEIDILQQWKYPYDNIPAETTTAQYGNWGANIKQKNRSPKAERSSPSKREQNTKKSQYQKMHSQCIKYHYHCNSIYKHILKQCIESSSMPNS